MKYEECQINYMDETGYFFLNNLTEIFMLSFFFLIRLHKKWKLSMENNFTLCFYMFIFQVFKPIVEKFNFTFNCDIKRR